jgi:TRAP-type C4-dicarboxylate transport system permease small subunit
LVNGRVELTGLVWRPLGWELAHALFRTLVLLAAVAGFRHRRRLEDRWLLAVLAAEFTVYTVFFPTTRLLAPFTAMLMVYAGYGLARHMPAARR